jgi:hypothetical protein
MIADKKRDFKKIFHTFEFSLRIPVKQTEISKTMTPLFAVTIMAITNTT